jgi:predicted phage terminase large subunit-like protein
VDLFSLEARIATDRAIVSQGTFFDFFQMAWPQIDPAPLVLNWHLEEKCSHLEAVSRGEIRRLVINEPPGSGKSNTVNILWNAWEWVHRPETKFLFASFDVSLVGTRDGGKLIRLLSSDWFRLRWGNLLFPGKPAASMFETVAGGFRFSTSPGGRGTGRHGDIRVIDDPIKPRDAAGGATMTKNALESVSKWCADTWASRATDRTSVRDVLIMQRLNTDDLAGEWLRAGNCVHLRFPMLYDPDRPCKTAWGGDRRTQKDELLFPKRFPLEEVLDMRDGTSPLSMGPDVFAAQCQQEPVQKGGGIFREEWWRFWDYQEGIPEPCLCNKCRPLKRTIPGCPDAPSRTCRVLPRQNVLDLQSWDCAFKDTKTSDFVAGGLIRVGEGAVFLVECRNERLSFTHTVEAIRVMSQANPQAYDKLVEDKANGAAIEDTLKAEIPGITLVNPEGGKIARANAGSIYMSGGRFYLPHPRIAPWVWAFMYQHENFPRTVNDDMVDMVSQVLVRLKKHGEDFSKAMAKLRGEAA